MSATLLAYPDQLSGIKSERCQLAVDANAIFQQQIQNCQLRFHFELASPAYSQELPAIFLLLLLEFDLDLGVLSFNQMSRWENIDFVAIFYVFAYTF